MCSDYNGSWIVSTSWVSQDLCFRKPCSTLVMILCLSQCRSDTVCELFAAGVWFFPGTPVSSIDKTDRHNITEILLKVALNTIILLHSKIQLKNYIWNKMKKTCTYFEFDWWWWNKDRYMFTEPELFIVKFPKFSGIQTVVYFFCRWNKQSKPLPFTVLLWKLAIWWRKV